MNEVDRYEPSWTEMDMLDEPEGDYVLYSDYAKLEDERDRLRAALMDIASAGCNEACEWLENDCDKCMLETAQQALRGGEEKDDSGRGVQK